MNFPPKAISVLLLVQCLFIWMGYALTRRMFRMLGAVELPWAPSVPASASFVLGFGLWALLMPLLWAAWVSLRSESHQSIPMTQVVDTKITLVLTLTTICVWSYGAMQAVDMVFYYDGPLTIVSQAE